MGLLREWHGGRPKAGLTWHKALAGPAALSFGAVGDDSIRQNSLDKCILKLLRLHS